MTKKNTKPEPQAGGYNVRSTPELLNLLDFTLESASLAATENTRLFMNAVDARLTTLAEKNAAKMNFEVAEANCELTLRQEYRESGEKITENAVKALVLVDENVRLARIALNTAEEKDEWQQRLVEAFRMRRDCLQIVERMANEERRLLQNTEASAKLAETRDSLRRKYPGGE